jgi:hypothetical protein
LDGSFHPCAMRSIPNALPGQVRYFDEQGKITDTQQLFHPPPIIQIRHRLRCKSSLMGMDLYVSKINYP